MNANKFWWEYVWTTSFVYCFIFLRSSGIYCYELNMWKKTSLLTGLVCVQRQIRALYYLKIWNFWEGSIFQDKFWMQVKAASHQNVFWNIFLNLLTISHKSIFWVSAVNCYCTYIFKGSRYIQIHWSSF